MKIPKYFQIMAVVSVLILACICPALAVDAVPDISSLDENLLPAKVIDPNLAAFVAADYLPAFYPDNWVLFDRLVAYDFDGVPTAYFVIFRDAGTANITPKELLVSLQQTSDEHYSLSTQIDTLEKSELSQEAKAKSIKDLKSRARKAEISSYRIGDFATVVAGATEESAPLIRCYKGLPEILVKKPDLQRQLKGKQEKQKEKLTLERILHLDPLDIRYEVVPDAGEDKAAIAETKVPGWPLAEESYMMSPKDKQLIKTKVLKEKIREHLAEKRMARARMREKQRKSLEQAEEAKKAHRISQWARLRTQFKKKQEIEEAKRDD
jgi:hypothetical protein